MTHECLARARRGDAAATENLVGHLRPRLTRMAHYYARVCHEEADDLLQEAFAAVLETLPALDLAIGDPEQYLLRVARWRVLDAVRRAQHRHLPLLEDEAVEPVAAQHTDKAGTADADMALFLGGLKETQRAVIACLLAGLTWREAGMALHCTSANIAYHVRQIRRQYEARQAGEPQPSQHLSA